MRPEHPLSRLPRPGAATAWSVAVALVILWAVLRLAVFHWFIFPLTYALPLLVCVWTRSRRMLWGMAGAFVALHSVKQAAVLPPGTMAGPEAFWVFAATMANIGIAAVAVDLILVLRTRLEDARHRAEEHRDEALRYAAVVRQQAEALASQNEELSQQTEELSQQAEELSQHAEELNQQSEELASQNEELKVQSEEIQGLNQELTRREELLAALLEAARVSGTERAVADRLCAAALELVGHPATVATLREQHDDRLVVLGSAGIAQAAAVPAGRATGSFASVVIRENRPASLNDASLRPDLELLDLVGRQRFGAVLASPVHVDAGALGVLEVHSPLPHAWTEEQFRLVRWLALQGSQILETLRLQRELREADDHKNQFLATLSHELRNPLAPIRYALELMAQAEGRPPGPPAASGTSPREVIERQLAHLVRLVDDLLDVTRIASNKIRLQKRLTPLDGILRQAVEATAQDIARARHTLEVLLPPEPIWLDADADRLAQVLINLLNNAARYTPDGGTLTLAARATGAEVVLSVKDTGVGLRGEDLHRIFEMFTQIGDQRGPGGLGIGLALVKGVVDLHGGRVEARSAGVGQGSEFLVRLPRAASPAATAAPPERAPAGASRRILVVDDNADSAEMMRAVLELDGHDVRVAYDGPSAVKSAKDFQPEVALLDIGLPGMDGYEVAQALRADAGTRRAQLIAVTGWGQEDDRKRARQHGFDAHLTKPADPDLIRQLVAPPPGGRAPAI